MLASLPVAILNHDSRQMGIPHDSEQDDNALVIWDSPYSYFDTAVTGHLVAQGGLDAASAPVIGVVVETKCQFRQELNFPEIVDAGIKVTKLGRTSVQYEIGLFRQGQSAPAAFGHFIHVYIDRKSRRPTPISKRVRAALAAISE